MTPSNPPLPPDEQSNEEFKLSCQLESQLGNVRTIGTKWFVYSPATGCWNTNERCVYLPLAMSLISKSKRTDRLAKNIVANLESRMQVPETNFYGAIRFESHNVVLINTKTCVLRVSTDAITSLPHAPVHGFTCSLDVAYDPDATCPTFDRVLAESLPDEQDQMLLLNFFGYTLMPDTRFQLSLLLHGVSGSGKSTLVEPLLHIYKHESLLTSFPIDSICTGKDYCLAHFQHAQVNICGELSSMEVTDSANFKSIVAGDVLQARGIYDQSARLRSICKLIFLANNPPRFRNGTPAENRRIATIHFANVPPPDKIDTNLRPALRNEIPGVFNYMLARLQALFTMSTMPQGGANSRTLFELFSLSNAPIETFVTRHCELRQDWFESKTRLEEVFANFVHTHGLHDGLTKTFLRRLREKFAMLHDFRPGHTDRTRCLKGIRLKADVDDVLDKAAEITTFP